MFKRHTAGLLLAAAAAAAARCSSHKIQLELPSEATTRAIVVALDYEGATTVTAIRVDPSAGHADLPRIKDFAGKAHLVAELFDKPLEQLDPPLPEGELLEAKMRGYERRLPTAGKVFEADVSADGATMWAQSAKAPDTLLRWRWKGDKNLCADFDPKVIDVGLPDDFTTLVDLPGGALLAASRYFPTLYRVDASGATDVQTWSDFQPVSAFRALDGRIWIAGTEGKLKVGTPETGFTDMPTAPSRSTLRWMDGQRSGTTFELYTMTERGHFERFDGTRWERLQTLTTSTSAINGGVAWVGPGNAVALPPQGSRFETVIFTTRPMGQFTFPSARVGELLTLRWVEGIGVMGLTKLNAVVKFEPPDFRRFDDSPPIGEPRVVFPFADGFIYAAPSVSLSQYSPIVGFCPVFSYSVPLDPFVWAPAGRSIAITGQVKRSGPGLILIITPK